MVKNLERDISSLQAIIVLFHVLNPISMTIFNHYYGSIFPPLAVRGKSKQTSCPFDQVEMNLPLFEHLCMMQTGWVRREASILKPATAGREQTLAHQENH